MDMGDNAKIANTENKIDIAIRMSHEGEVNKLRVMPRSTSIIATKSPNANVYIYDYTKH